jgi:hypothetical protein
MKGNRFKYQTPVGHVQTISVIFVRTDAKKPWLSVNNTQQTTFFIKGKKTLPENSALFPKHYHYPLLKKLIFKGLFLTLAAQLISSKK